MKNLSKIFLCLSLLIAFLSLSSSVFAIENPMAKPNNKQGIHILFPSELSEAAALLNSTGGDWGYVTIPIQSGDRDLEKWQKFFDDAKSHHLIPIVRLATEGDLFNTAVWRKPNEADILDFANFLNSLTWPTKNRYVIVFNEVNRADEWGGEANPSEYAHLLSYAVTIFKSKSEDFFMIASGMDNGAPNMGSQYIDQYAYFNRMNSAYPNIFTQIDGISSHSYPNPGFIQPPNSQTTKSIMSFKYEKNLIDNMAKKDLPVFITETGWDRNVLGDETVASYYKIAYERVWNDASVIAVTPFLLRATGGPFEKFSFINETGAQTKMYETIKALPKTAGAPTFATVLGKKIAVHKPILIESFPEKKPKPRFSMGQILVNSVSWVLKL